MHVSLRKYGNGAREMEFGLVGEGENSEYNNIGCMATSTGKIFAMQDTCFFGMGSYDSTPK